MGIITLISDWGESDHYVAAVKAKIYTHLPMANILDITHHVPLFDIGKAAYFLKNVYPYSPAGTVHIIGVNTIADKNCAHLVVCYNNQFFISADNGIFSILFPKDDMPTEIYEITEMQDSESFTFPSRDLFAKVAAFLASGTSPDKLGKPAQICNRITPSFPISREERDENGRLLYLEIVGDVIYIDRYENINTNIHQSLFAEMQAKFARFEIYFGKYSVDKISTAYSDVSVSDILALFASDSYLQIAMNEAKASGLLNIRKNAQIVVRFEN